MEKSLNLSEGKSMQRIPGIALLVAGVILLIWGINAAESFTSEMSETFTGSPSNKTIWLIVLGVIGTVSGLLLSLWPRRKRS